jgi:hypothetical protein
MRPYFEFENYVFIKLIGSGSFGDVWTVFSKTTKNNYAAKILRVIIILNNFFTKYFF